MPNDTFTIKRKDGGWKTEDGKWMMELIFFIVKL